MVVGVCHNRHCGPFQWFSHCWKIFLTGTKRPPLSCFKNKKEQGGTGLNR
jgi:hypothetical protein